MCRVKVILIECQTTITCIHSPHTVSYIRYQLQLIYRLFFHISYRHHFRILLHCVLHYMSDVRDSASALLAPFAVPMKG